MQKQMNLTNIVVVEGYVLSPVNLVFEDEKNTHKACFYLNNPCQVGRNSYINDFYIVVFGKKAKECNKVLSVGDKCTVTGKITRWYKGGKNGVTQTGITIFASDVSFG